MNFKGLLESGVTNIINPFVYFLFVLAFVYFLLGVLGLFDEKKREEAKQKILYGVIALFVMSAVWGLVNVVAKTFNLDNARPNPPSVTGTSGSGFISNQFRNDGTVLPPGYGGTPGDNPFNNFGGTP